MDSTLLKEVMLMRLFQYEQIDSTVSIILAENKEEACDILLEFQKNINISNMIPLRNLLLNLKPITNKNKVCWKLNDMGFNTILELPLIENNSLKSKVKCKVINIYDHLK